MFSLYHSVGYKNHTVKYISHSVKYESRTVKQRNRKGYRKKGWGCFQVWREAVAEMKTTLNGVKTVFLCLLCVDFWADLVDLSAF